MKNELHNYLLFKCMRSLKKKSLINEKKYRNRLIHEWKIIKKLDFSQYFIILSDIINYAKTNNILVADGRGSAAGSLVCFLLGITNIDPIKFDLMFERFLNEGRKELPDIDTDFDSEKREIVLNYVRNKYGKDNVINIGTIGIMKFKMSLKNICNVYNYNFFEINALTKDIPDDIDDNEIKVENYPALNKFYLANKQNKKVVDMALRLRGSVHHLSVHPAGILLMTNECRDKIPLMRYKDQIVTSWSEGVNRKELTSIGYTKYDFLGINTLSIMQEILNILGWKNNDYYELYEKYGEDEKVYRNFSRGSTLGIFQFAEDQVKGLLKQIKPDNFEQITAINAINRPGCLLNNVHKSYAEYKHNGVNKNVIHEKVYNLLKDTYGLLIYQEQYIKIATELAGMTAIEGDDLRKIVSKKPQLQKDGSIDPKYESFKNRFLKGVEKETSREVAKTLWNMIINSASYVFNKSHSAAYAMLAYKMMWFKTHYPIEFYLANIRHLSIDKFRSFYEEMKKNGIKLLPIDINRSKLTFERDGENIRYGLSNIKYLSPISAKLISDGQPYKSFEDFIQRVNVNKRVVFSLIKAGAFDNLLSKVEAFAKYWQIRKFKEENTYKNINELDILQFEREIYSFIISEDIFTNYIKSLGSLNIMSINGVIKEKSDGSYIFAFVDKIRKAKTHNGNTMWFLDIYDVSQSSSMIIWANEYYRNKDIINSIKSGSSIYCKVKYNCYNGKVGLILGEKIKVVK